MSTPFPFSILTPMGPLAQNEVLFVGVRSVEGSLGVLANHAPMVAACPPGVVRVQHSDGWHFYATTACLLTTDGKNVDVLAGRAEEQQDELSALRTAQEWTQSTEI